MINKCHLGSKTFEGQKKRQRRSPFSQLFSWNISIHTFSTFDPSCYSFHILDFLNTQTRSFPFHNSSYHLHSSPFGHKKAQIIIQHHYGSSDFNIFFVNVSLKCVLRTQRGPFLSNWTCR